MVVFDASDVDYLAQHFNINQLRHEIKHSRNRLYRFSDPENQAFEEDFIKSCQLAIEMINPVVNKRSFNNGKKLESTDSIKSRYDLVDYIGQYIQLHKSGDKFRGLCPFHADKRSESFFVYPDNTFHCFGCQIHGSIIDFVMKYENLDIKSVLTKLSR